MVEWTESEKTLIQRVWDSIDVNVVGPLVLRRCLIVNPWTQRYFGKFGDLTTELSIMTNEDVAKHGVVVMKGMKMGLDTMDTMKKTYSDLSVLHSEKLHVDPDNFKLLCDCLTIVVAGKMGLKFSPAMQAAWQKYLNVVISALTKQYH